MIIMFVCMYYTDTCKYALMMKSMKVRKIMEIRKIMKMRKMRDRINKVRQSSTQTLSI